MKNDQNERLARALDWCKKRGIRSGQLNLFDKQFKKKRDKSIEEKEFKEMCKKAGVEPGSLAKTVFTRNLESS